MKILFVCTGNTCRSPMAEGLLRQMAEDAEIDDIEVSSAGIFAFENQAASKNAIAVADSRGVDLRGHRARKITKKQIAESDIVLTMTDSHRGAIVGSFTDDSEKVQTLNGFVQRDGEIMDPFGCSMEVYEQTMLDIVESLELLIEKLVQKKR